MKKLNKWEEKMNQLEKCRVYIKHGNVAALKHAMIPLREEFFDEDVQLMFVEYAALYGQLEVMMYLVKTLGFRFEPGFYDGNIAWDQAPISRAAFWGHKDIMKYLINECHAYIKEECVISAIKGNEREIAHRLCDCNSRISYTKCLREALKEIKEEEE